MSMQIYGIDVSSWQQVIDWDTVKTELERVNNYSNSGFAMIRLGYSSLKGYGGLVLDKQAKRNLSECNRVGIPCGVYVYSYDVSMAAAKKTMRDAIAAIRDYKIEYPVAFDIEYEDYNVKAGKAANTEVIIGALKTVEDAGYYAMVYASRDFFLNYANISDLEAYDKWEAAYTSTDTSAVKNGIWQYSSKNALGIKGISTIGLDCNIAYKDYKKIITSAKLNRLS